MAGKFTQSEKQELVAVFEGMHVKPDTSDPESITQWMKSYLKGTGKLKDATDAQSGTQLIHTPKVTNFSGDESLRGEAARVAMRLGEEAAINDIIFKF